MDPEQPFSARADLGAPRLNIQNLLVCLEIHLSYTYTRDCLMHSLVLASITTNGREMSYLLSFIYESIILSLLHAS